MDGINYLLSAHVLAVLVRLKIDQQGGYAQRHT